MPADRARKAVRCLKVGPDGRQVVVHALSAEQVAKLDPKDKQYKYHQNVMRYAGKKINIRGEHGHTRPAVRTQMTEEERNTGKPPPLRLADMELIRMLGAGAFGQVAVVRALKRDPPHVSDMKGSQLALKVLDKRKLRETAPAIEPVHGSVHDLLSLERRNLAMIDWNPFVAGLFNCLQDSKNVYQLMELGHCGTLSALIKKTKGGLPTSVCRFYMANLVAALEFIHSLGLVHSDLKPGNIVIGADGYLMICDLGVSAFEHEERDWNDVGTTMYAPPDCIKGNMPPPGRRSMDVWAVGCILFEMATGRAAFRMMKAPEGETQSKPRRIELLNRVGSARWFWPRGMVVDETLKDMVNKMLAKEISERLGAIYTPGSRKNDELRAHPFLRKFPWHQLNNRTLVAPYVPLAVPDLAEQWHTKPLPPQEQLPGITIVKPPPHVEWDNRFESENARRRKERAWERKQAEREQRRDGLPVPNAAPAINRVQEWKAGVGAPRANNDDDPWAGLSLGAKEERRKMAEELLAKAMEGRYDPPETILAKGGRARSVVPRGEDPVENPTSSDPDPTESFIIPKPTIPDSPPAQVASLPDIPGPSKSALPPPHREAEVPAEKSPSSSSPPSPGVARSPFSKKLASGPTVLPPWKPVFNRSPRRNRPGPLPSASRQFQMPRTVKREPTFKEPMLPERILTGEFNRLVFRPRMSTSPIEVPPEFQPKSPRDSSPIEAPRDVKDVEDMALA